MLQDVVAVPAEPAVQGAGQADALKWQRRLPPGASRALLGGGLLLAEYLLVSWTFDAFPLRKRIDWSSGLGYVGPLVIVTATSALLFGRRELKAILDADFTSRRVWPWLALHAPVVVLFFVVTARVFGRVGRTSPEVGKWFALWIALGASVVLTLAPLVISWSTFRSVLRRGRLPFGFAALFGLAAWIAGRWSEDLWTVLGAGTVRAAGAVIGVFVNDVIARPDVLQVGTARFFVRVAPVCSGCEGIGLILVVTVVYLVWFRKELRFPLALLLLPAGIVMAWVANVLRIATLVWIGNTWSRKIAYGAFHSKAGWILFCVVALGLASAAQRFASTDSPKLTERDATAAYLAPFLAMTAAGLVAGAFGAGFDLSSAVGALAGLAAFSFYYRELRELLVGRCSWASIVLGLAAGALLLLVPRLLPRAEDVTRAAGLLQPPVALFASWASRSLTLLVAAPLAQEIAFRGFLLPRLVSSDFSSVSLDRWRWAPALVSALAFGVLERNWIAATIAGLLYALAQARHGRVADAIAAHATANACLLGWYMFSADQTLIA